MFVAAGRQPDQIGETWKVKNNLSPQLPTDKDKTNLSHYSLDKKGKYVRTENLFLDF